MLGGVSDEGPTWFDDQSGRSTADRDLRRLLEPERRALLRAAPTAIVVIVGILTVIAMVLLRPTGEQRPDLSLIGIDPLVFDAVAEAVVEVPCQGTTIEDDIPCQAIDFRLGQGPDTESIVSLEMPMSDTSPAFDAGDRVVLAYNPDAEPGFEYLYYDRQRRPVLAWLAVIFAIAVVALGRLRGLAALVGLGASVMILLQFVIPAIIDGRSPLLVAIVGASAIAYVALYAAHGFTRMTTVALLGTLAALGLTAVMSWVALGIADLSGFVTEEAFFLTLVGRIDISGIVLAGVVLGSLGAIDDVTVTQASAVWEVRRANPNLGRIALFRSGLRVGRDHVASTVNTLLLAYAGAAMPLLLFFVLSQQSVGTVLNSEIVATEVLRTLLGSTGLVAAVPLTTYLAALIASDD